MKKLLTLLLLALTFQSFAQNYPVTGINITLSENPDPNTANWGSGNSMFEISASSIVENGSVPALVLNSKLLVYIKKNGIKFFGDYTINTAPVSNFDKPNKIFRGDSAVSYIGKAIVLPTGDYELCVQFFGNGAAGLTPISEEKTKAFSISADAVKVTPGGPDSICQSANPTPILLSGASVGGSATTGAWSITSGGGNLSNITQTLTPSSVTYTPAANYSGTVILTLTTNGTPPVSATRTITVNALPVVSAPASVAVGSSITLSPTTGGTWVSNDPLIASVNPSNGEVTGLSPGTATFTFTDAITRCNATTSSVAVFDCIFLCNTGFENPVVGPSVSGYRSPGFIQTPEINVPCWNTTASDGKIEIWDGRPTAMNATLTPLSGNQFAELNCTQLGTLYQKFTAIPNQQVLIKFLHMGRYDGLDKMELRIGPDDGTGSSIYPLVGTYYDNYAGGWTSYSIPYQFSSLGGPYQIRFVSISSNGGDTTTPGGNFLDNISIECLKPGETTVTPGGPDNICQSASPTPILLSGASVGGAATMGTWSIVSGNGSLINSGPTATPSSSSYLPAVNDNIVLLKLTTNSIPAISATRTITVNALPVVSAPVSVAVNGTITLSPSTGGTWISNNPSIASVNPTGVVTGLSVGTATFTFTDAITRCNATSSLVTVGSSCTDFEGGTLGGWQVNNTLSTIILDGTNHYVQTTDLSGASLFYNETDYAGDWGSLLVNGCGSLCWDVNYFYAGSFNGVDNDGSSQPITITPSIGIVGGPTNNLSATFVTNNLITAGDGWHSYCAPLMYLNPGDPFPSNANGQWVMPAGSTYLDWNALLDNVIKVQFGVDPTSYSSERFGFDNICIKNTGDCAPLCCDNVTVESVSSDDTTCCAKITATCEVKALTVTVSNGILSSASWNCGPIGTTYVGQASYTFAANGCIPVLTTCVDATTSGIVTLTYTIEFANGEKCEKQVRMDCIAPSCCEQIDVYSKSDQDCCAMIVSSCKVKSVAISVTNGTISSASWPCSSLPAGYIGASNFTFPGNDCVLALELCVDAIQSGIVNINYTIYLSNGEKCEKNIEIKCTVPVQSSCCPLVDFKLKHQWPHLNSLLGTFEITNVDPSSPICSVEINTIPATSFVGGTLWIDQVLSSQSWNSSRIPASGNLSPSASNKIKFSMSAINYEGIIEVCVIKCDGSRCCYTFKWNTKPTPKVVGSIDHISISKPLFALSVLPLIKTKVDANVKWVCFGLDEKALEKQRDLEFFALSGAALEEDGSLRSNIEVACMGKYNAFFELREAKPANGNLGLFNLVFLNTLPDLNCTLFDEEGNIVYTGISSFENGEIVTSSVEFELYAAGNRDLFEFIKLYPNPNNGQFKITYAIGSEKNITLQIINLKGQVITEVNQPGQMPGIHETSIEAGPLPGGHYSMVLKANGVVQTKSFVIK